MNYSEIFTRIETVMSEFTDLIEDYSVSDTTLEDVFLQFASDANEMLPGIRSSSTKVRVQRVGNCLVGLCLSVLIHAVQISESLD